MKTLWKVGTNLLLLGGFVWCATSFSRSFHAVTEGLPGANRAAMMAWFGGLLLCAVLLGLRIAADVGRWVGGLTESYILQGETPDTLPEEIKTAEEMLTQKRPLDAVNLLRDFLELHPGEDYARFRIAEIYAEQLRNPLAAALEYEQLLTRKLDPERWGWTAIRLSRLYHKMRDFDKAEALLNRVIKERSKTGAARKAEKLLKEWAV
jgi:signal transduction histidine kinase